MELEQLLTRTEELIRAQIDLPAFRPGKVSMWIKFVQFEMDGGSRMEKSVGHVHKLIFLAASYPELVRQVAENLVLAVYGAETPVVKDLPNLIIRLFDQKAYVPTPGAPPLEEPGQIFLKATVYSYQPDVWEQMFGRKQPDTTL